LVAASQSGRNSALVHVERWQLLYARVGKPQLKDQAWIANNQDKR
jgi:hypothetical protein